jgi:hypothetical protein
MRHVENSVIGNAVRNLSSNAMQTFHSTSKKELAEKVKNQRPLARCRVHPQDYRLARQTRSETDYVNREKLGVKVKLWMCFVMDHECKDRVCF